MENNKHIFEGFESTFMYFQNPIALLNIQNIKLDIPVNIGFELYFAYSYDNQNYSDFRKQDYYKDEILDNENYLYLCVWLKRIIDNDLTIPTHLYEQKPTEDKYFGNYSKIKNVDETISRIIINSIEINNKNIDVTEIKFQEYFRLIDEFPRWNFYDNQTINIQRWLNQCNSIAEMYGHTCIYFKTEPVEFTEKNPQSGIHGTHHQLQNNVIRNVVDIKKLHILCPNNELPQDRIIYTDWDMPLQDDFVIHIVRQKFEQAFGLKSIPNEKDYIYLPIINKLFRVSTMQPKNGFMGVVGWYEVFLSKYENDECVTIDKDLKQMLSGIPTNDDIENFEEKDFLIDEFNNYLEDTEYSDEKITQKTVEEQKEVTQNYTNKLEDSSFYVSLKETEKLREFYDKRLKIVSVNPDDSVYPITMYNCSDIDKRTVALKYNLTDYSVKNKFSNIINNTYDFCFNFVMLNRFNGELFSIMSGDNAISTFLLKNKQLIMFDTATQTEAYADYKFIENELYQICINFDYNLKQYSFKIFKLKNRQKSLEYQNIYNLSQIMGFVQNKIKITNLLLFGGKFLTNDITLSIDKQKFIEDNCLPLLNYIRY